MFEIKTMMIRASSEGEILNMHNVILITVLGAKAPLKIVRLIHSLIHYPKSFKQHNFFIMGG